MLQNKENKTENTVRMYPDRIFVKTTELKNVSEVFFFMFGRFFGNRYCNVLKHISLTYASHEKLNIRIVT